MIIREEYLNWLIKLKDKHIIKVVSGVRRCGKSTLFTLYKNYLCENGVEEKQIISINFEDNKYNNLLDADVLHEYILNHICKDSMNYIFLDEVQNVKNFEKCVNSLFLNENLDIYITGSNSYMLSGELATFLTGRYMQINMLPLSFKEFFSVSKDKNELKEYERYVEVGGFPYLIYLDNDTELIRNYLDGIYNTVLLKDVISRNKKKDVMILYSVIKFLFDNIGRLVSINKISDTLKSNGRSNSINTIESYVSALLDSYIIYRVSRYDIRGKEYLKTGDKYYLCDVGLRYYLLGGIERKDAGRVLENIIFLELKRRGYEIFIGKNDDKEVDFVVRNKDGVKYIQVCLTARDEKTFEREISALDTIKDHNPKYLITLDYDKATYNGIKQISAIDFLLGRENI
ncbi:MAG: ATP-binding protein [Clostridia bacterium]|nr:ATP-binding protein [Clostridia bacterium]